MTTGWPPGLLQDDSLRLSDWFASRVDARWTVRRVCAEIERNRMTDKQPDALRLADELLEPMEGFPEPTTLEKNAAALLRTQHAAIERKDALLRQALGALEQCWNDPNFRNYELENEAARAIKQELSQ